MNGKPLVFFFSLFLSGITLAADMSTVLQSRTDTVNGFSELTYVDGFLRGQYEIDGDTITVEVNRGKRTPAIMRRLNSDWPIYEIDVRILDSEGDPIYVQVGGHDPVDATWGLEFDASLSVREATDPEIRNPKARKSYEAAYQMLTKLKGAKIQEKLTPEREALEGAMNILQSAMSSDLTSSEEEQVAAFGCTDTQIIEVWKKSAFFPGNILGDHSGTVMKTKSGSTTYTVWVAANHGTAPGASGMSKKCSQSFTERCGQSIAPPMCSTPVQWETSKPLQDDDKHVCNDDSYIQVLRIKTNAGVSTTGGTCNDTTLRSRAPSCT